jgi:hypothetical protein
MGNEGKTSGHFVIGKSSCGGIRGISPLGHPEVRGPGVAAWIELLEGLPVVESLLRLRNVDRVQFRPGIELSITNLQEKKQNCVTERPGIHQKGRKNEAPAAQQGQSNPSK